MTGVVLQFHADPEELFEELLPEWLQGHAYWALPEYGRSLSFDVEGLRSPDESRAPDRVFLRLEPFEEVVGGADAVLAANPGGLGVDVGVLRDGELTESVIGTTTGDREALAVWRSVVRRARRDLLSGGTWTGPSGDTDAAPSRRYSRGALELHRRGTRLVNFPGGSTFTPN